MLVSQLEVGPMRNFAYIIGDQEGGSGVVIDPTAELDRLEAELQKYHLNLRYVINTHAHFDHIGGNQYLRSIGAKLVAHQDAPTNPDIKLKHEEILMLGNLPIRCLHTPGHSFDGICLVADKYLFTGDTLFIEGCGRTDLPGSDSRAMYHSLTSIIASLPDELIVMPGHDYGPVPQRTLGEEKQKNFTLSPRAIDNFRDFMG
ncbi:MAG: MBL fold metallo-hydrolase [Deltaproteobacteria bacterium]|nr:MBL fold metallo-hydrolase [Deltaproteobacteria bacterium]